MSSQFQSVILTIAKVVASDKAMMEDVRAVEEQGIPMVSLLDEYLGGDDSRTVISTGGISATTFVSVIANYVGSIGMVIVSKDETGMEKQITEIINLRSTLADRDENIRRVRKALLDEGVHPPFHRRQVERLRQEWPTLYNAIMDLVKP